MCPLNTYRIVIYAPEKLNTPNCNSKQYLAESKQSNKSLQSFPVDTFKPKVQLQHEVEPKTLPRNVAIERLRREYQVKNIQNTNFQLLFDNFQSKDLSDLLQEKAVKPKDLLPIEILNKHFGKQDSILRSWVSFLPLELFDNEDYDIR